MALRWAAHLSGGALVWGLHFDGGAPPVPIIASLTPVGGTRLLLAWTGTATHYRINGGAATALPDGNSPDVISGLSPATLYTVEVRNGVGEWSASASAWTDNTGGGDSDFPPPDAVLPWRDSIVLQSPITTRVNLVSSL